MVQGLPTRYGVGPHTVPRPTGARTNPDALAKRALEVERAIQEGISAARQTLDEIGALSYGLDNFLAGLADGHEKALYLLSRRTL